MPAVGGSQWLEDGTGCVIVTWRLDGPPKRLHPPCKLPGISIKSLSLKVLGGAQEVLGATFWGTLGLG